MVRSLLFSMFVVLCVQAAGAEPEWKELKGTHFIVYHARDKKDADRDAEAFAKRVLEKAEARYKVTADELGYERRSDFWTWDKRVKIYVYADHDTFVKGTNQPEWSKGVANYTQRKILSYRKDNEDQFVEAILPHELGHLVFRDFIGFEGEVPRWLDEGVAQWQEEPKRAAARLAAREVARNKQLLSLKDLTSIDQERLYQEMEEEAVHAFYIQAVSLVDMMITKYGTDRFTKFCRQLRDGKSLNDALKRVYSTTMKNIEEMETQFIEYLKEEPK